MSAPVKFTQADVKRAASGVLLAGLQIARIEIDSRGKIVVIPSNGDPHGPVAHNPWDDE